LKSLSDLSSTIGIKPDEISALLKCKVLKRLSIKNAGLKSYAKPVVDDWTVPESPISTSGGGVQLLVNDMVKKSVIGI